MNKYIFSIALLLFSFFMVSCDKDDDDDMDTTDLDYHAHIHSPNSDNKHIGDTIHIHVAFESHTGMTIHHANVRIYKEKDGTEIYNEPGDDHVNESSGEFEWHDSFVLSNANGVTEHTDWIMEAKVWGEASGEEEVKETVEFHVHP